MSRQPRHRRVMRFAYPVLLTTLYMGSAWLLHLAASWIVGLPWPILAISALVVMWISMKAALGALLLGGLSLLASPTVVLFLGGASIVIGLVLELARSFEARSGNRRPALARPQQASDRAAGLIEASFAVPDTARPLELYSRHWSVVDEYLGRGGSVAGSSKAISGARYRQIEIHLSGRAGPRMPPAVTAHAARAVDAHFSPPKPVPVKWNSEDQYRRIDRHLSEDAERGRARVIVARAARAVEHHFNPPDLLTVFDRLPSHARQRYLRTLRARVVT